MMAMTSTTGKTKPDNQNLTRSRSLGRKPKPVPSSETEATADGSGRKPVEKPLPNYLRPTISSRPDPVKFLKKNNTAEDKLLRRRSFDRPPSSSTSPSTSPSQKYLSTPPPARPRDRPVVPREKPVTGLRSTSFHGSGRGGLGGSSTVASRGSPGVKKSGLRGASSSKSKKEGSENVPKNSSAKNITAESSTLAPPQEDEEEIIKVETHVEGSDHREKDKDQVAQPDESVEGKETGLMDASTENEKGELIKEDITEEQKEETVVTPDMKEAADVEEEEEESESSKVKEGTTETEAQVENLPEVSTKKEVVQGKKESPTAYNDVIASKLQESSRKNKVLALAGAFQTVIDYETAASK
ncbi:Calmodulin-binding protein-like protein [Hirschfeldia incana]|nr:Calmodulin-binding protein-like protein [Hirschfeldia incana]